MNIILTPEIRGSINFLRQLFLCALLMGAWQRAEAQFQVNSMDGNVITIHFEQQLSPQTATDTGFYTILGKGPNGANISVTNVILLSDQQTVALFADASAGEFFAVAVNGLPDIFNNPITGSATGFLNNNGLTDTSIGNGQDPSPVGEVFPIFADTFQVTASGSDIGGTADHCHFVYEKVTGNFEMSALVTRLDPLDNGAKAGLMVREDVSAGSRSLGIYFTPLIPGVNTNQIQMLLRFTTNGTAVQFAATVPSASLKWLRLTRTNNLFTAYYGTNGSTWSQCGSVSQAFNATLSAGLAVTSHKNGSTTTAGFTSFGIAGVRPGDGNIPTVSASVYQKTNLVVKWQRTPRDFCVQVATNLFGNTNSSGGNNFTNATQWGFVLFPVFDTSITGTNAMMPSAGRYMVIPTDLFTNTSQMFVRLARVERLIPDPLSVTPGIILSQASGTMTTGSSGATLCSSNIDSTTAMAQVGVPILCPVGKTYQFTTSPSGSTLQTAIQVRNYPSIGTTTCDAAYSAGSYKSQVTLTPASPNSGYTFVAAATSAVKPTTCNAIKVQVNIR